MEKYIVEELKKLPYTLRELSEMTGIQISRVQRIKTGFPLWASELIILSDFVGKEVLSNTRKEAFEIISKARKQAKEMAENEAVKLLSLKHGVPVEKILWAIGTPE